MSHQIFYNQLNMKTVRVNEYYDLFDVKKIDAIDSISLTNIDNRIKDHNTYNVFSGFSNWEDFTTTIEHGIQTLHRMWQITSSK